MKNESKYSETFKDVSRELKLTAEALRFNDINTPSNLFVTNVLHEYDWNQPDHLSVGIDVDSCLPEIIKSLELSFGAVTNRQTEKIISND